VRFYLFFRRAPSSSRLCEYILVSYTFTKEAEQNFLSVHQAKRCSVFVGGVSWGVWGVVLVVCVCVCWCRRCCSLSVCVCDLLIFFRRAPNSSRSTPLPSRANPEAVVRTSLSILHHPKNVRIVYTYTKEAEHTFLPVLQAKRCSMFVGGVRLGIWGVVLVVCVCVCRCRCRGCCSLSVCVCVCGLLTFLGERRAQVSRLFGQVRPHLFSHNCTCIDANTYMCIYSFLYIYACIYIFVF